HGGQPHRRAGAGREYPAGRGARLRDRAGAPWPRPHPPLHAHHRRGRRGAGGDDAPPAVSRRLRQADRRAFGLGRTRRPRPHRHRDDAPAVPQGRRHDGPRGQQGGQGRDRHDQGPGADDGPAHHRRCHSGPRRRRRVPGLRTGGGLGGHPHPALRRRPGRGPRPRPRPVRVRPPRRGRPMSDLDVARLGQWLAGILPAAPADIRLEKFPGGQSNPTYRMTVDGRDYVLRRRPFGPLLPSAHAVEREYRLISALHPTGFPVPAPLALCQDDAVIGSAFYVMELVEGRTFWNGALPGLSPSERRAAYEAMVDTLAQLHSVDPVAVGLEDFGRPGNYFERQVARWTKQYRAAQTDDLPEVERLIDFLPRTAPE